ncbi:MAG: hypothetical protein JXO51_00110 [Candidatus Aminicenantes bacterium]|nr:hypothetical protein [Candidatus Aminicenantes bacterium]
MSEGAAERNRPRRRGIGVIVLLLALCVYAAYHHQGERDSGHFLKAYPHKAGGKLDHCALCHGGGSLEKDGVKVALGSCQWCHFRYGYDRRGPLAETLNAYGRDYLEHGRDAGAIAAIAASDSDGDGFSNHDEILAERFPGNPDDDPKKTAAPMRVYSREQLEALPQHTQFLLQNAPKDRDEYAEFSGVVLETLLADAGILPSATGVTVFAPDGWSQYHPLRPLADPAMYPVLGIYPEAVFHFSPAAVWCDYRASSCAGCKPGAPIRVPGGLRMLLALRREGQPLAPAVLARDNKLNGEGPFRLIVPQKTPSPPDRPSPMADQEGLWPYRAEWDHNAGSSTRSVTMIRVEPLPEGTTDIDIAEAGWRFIDEGKIVVFGAIRGLERKPGGRPPAPSRPSCPGPGPG